MHLREGLMTVATHRILTTHEEGPARGTLLMGRYLDEDAIESLGKITQLRLMIYRIDDTHLPADFRQAVALLSAHHPITER